MESLLEIINSNQGLYRTLDSLMCTIHYSAYSKTQGCQNSAAVGQIKTSICFLNISQMNVKEFTRA